MLDPDISTAAALRHLTTPEARLDPAPPTAHQLDRRRFLQLIGMGAGAGAVAGPGSSILDSLLGDRADTSWAAGPIGPDDGILVVLGMFGGNDGLNTVVPINDGIYYDQHGSLSIPAGDTLRLDADTGLNPALTELKSFWDVDQLAIVEGIGYPDADLSHFNSMANWMSARVGGVPTSGWLGRWLDGHLGGTPDLFAAAEIGTGLPLHMVGQSSRGTTIPASRPSFGAGTGDRDLNQYATVRSINATSQPFWSKQVSQAFVDQLDLSKVIVNAVPEDLPDVDIVARMEVAARLINANLGFRVLTAGWGDFDSHAGQANQHPVRMVELNAAIQRFFQVLDPSWANRVTFMTFSEFGRTSHSNGSGTDHGTAAPHFVFGPAVKGGRYGQRPSLAGLRQWDRMEHHVDFRDYYGSVIDGWLGGGSRDVLGRTTEDLDLFTRAPSPDEPTVVRPPTAPPPDLPPVELPPAAAPRLGGDFVSMSPRRIVDSRDGTGGRSEPLGSNDSMTVTVPGLPASGATAVVVNVTAANTTAASFLTAYPYGATKPVASNLNTTPVRPVSNLVTVGLSADGKFDIANRHGSTDCIVDLMGYFADTSASQFTPLVPARLLDTRPGGAGHNGAVAGGNTIDVAVTGKGGVPKNGVSAVVVNVTSVNASLAGFVKVFPTGDKLPSVSNVNYVAGLVTPNLVMCKVGKGGKVSLFASHGTTDLLVDVVGCYTDSGSRHVAISPKRILDTREGVGAAQRRVGTKQTITLKLLEGDHVPGIAKAVILNVAAVGPSSESFITVYPDGEKRPTASNLNMVAGQTVPNLVVAKLGTGGRVNIFNRAGTTDVIADVAGYYV